MFKLNDSDIDYLTEEVYEIIWTIKDPEFPKTLEELDVVDPHNIILQINQHTKQINVKIIWTPTTPSCSFALNIALSIIIKLQREFS